MWNFERQPGLTGFICGSEAFSSGREMWAVLGSGRGNPGIPDVIKVCTSAKLWLGSSAGLWQFPRFSGRKSPNLAPRSFRQHLSGTNPCLSMCNKTELWFPLKKWREGRKEECLCSIKYFHYASDVRKFLVGLRHLWHDCLENKHKTLWCMASSVACFHT